MNEKKLKQNTHSIEAARLYNEIHPNRPPTSQTVVRRIKAKFRECGHVRDLPKSGRPAKEENNQLEVLLSMEENPHISANLHLSLHLLFIEYLKGINIIHIKLFQYKSYPKTISMDEMIMCIYAKSVESKN